ncbi:MAG: hypothetical protein QW687_00045 [Candidatus Hadarchaeales archaeon]
MEMTFEDVFYMTRYTPRAVYRPTVRLDKDLLYKPPYDELRKYTRLWYATFREIQLLSQFQKSDILREFLSHSRINEWVSYRLQFAYDIKDWTETKIAEVASTLPEWREWGKYIPGVGELSFGKLIGLTGNPAARAYVTNLWRFCGFGVVDGKLEKYTKGERGHYNPQVKSYLWVVVSNILKCYSRSPSFYGVYYYVWKEKLSQTRPDWTPLRVHLTAIIKTAKMFLAHLWEISRRTQNLPVPYPYPVEFLGHKTVLPADIALHPVKKSNEVIRAIQEVEYLLRDEPDTGVVVTTKQILDSYKLHVSSPKEKKKGKGKSRRRRHT